MSASLHVAIQLLGCCGWSLGCYYAVDKVF